MSKPEEICNLPKMAGGEVLTRKAKLMRWFYNSETGKCEMFTYNGYNGNKNNFKSQELCEEFRSKK